MGYLSSSSSPQTESQPLQNLLTFLHLHSLIPDTLHVLSYRRNSASHLLHLAPQSTSGPQDSGVKVHAHWEKDFSGKRVARRHDLSTMMDPKRRISEARDLNNNLMRWRVATGIDLEVIKRAKVLVLGMGTLGCGVVRALMVRNPQSLDPPRKPQTHDLASLSSSVARECLILPWILTVGMGSGTI